MARNDGIDRTLARNQDLETPDDVTKVQEHNEREKDRYSNVDIVPERTALNVHFKSPTDDYVKMFEQMEQDKIISTRGLKPDAVKYGELVFDVNSAYFYNHGGYELAKQKLIDNTEAFVNGKQANNCLLYGDAGTGKSTSIKAIANQYYDRGLRLIEVYKHQFCDLNDVIAQIKNRNYKFIIYMDDLSFEEFEIEYKYLKAVIEGGLEKKPDNVLIYATSNRRHLIRETFSDKEEVREDMHTSDTVQEKLSLYARFGVSIYFGAPNKKEFQNIVKVLAEKYQVSMDEDTLLAEANKWELSHGGLSGRTAQQFINYLLGKE